MDVIGPAFRNAMRRLASTVTIISVGNPVRRHGITATAVTSVSMEPPALLTCVNRSSALHALMEEHERFCINLLHRDHVQVSQAFSGHRTGKQRFEYGEWATHATGLPFLTDAQSNIFCRKTLAVPYGTHTIFIGEVFDVQTRSEIAPLMYANGAYATCTPMEMP